MKINNRLNNIGDYHFKIMDEYLEKYRELGREIFDFSIGDPDLCTSKEIKDTLIKTLNEKQFNLYPPYDGINELKSEIIKYYKEVFSVNLDLDEVIILIGSKEGISNIIPAVCDINDYIIIPEPGYPVYKKAAMLWGVNPYSVILSEKNKYLPKLDEIPNFIKNKAKLFFINYPNNPTGASADKIFYKDIINFCGKNNIVLCNDSAYNEIIEEKENPESILQYDKNKNCIEFGSFSKTYNMTGFRIGYAVGNREIISALLKVKSNLDSGQFKPVQYAAACALRMGRDYVSAMRQIYDRRRKLAKQILITKNIKFFDASSTFYLWCKVPYGHNCEEFCREILETYGIVFTAGNVFGKYCNDYFRVALTKDEKIIEKAFNKLKIYS